MQKMEGYREIPPSDLLKAYDIDLGEFKAESRRIEEVIGTDPRRLSHIRSLLTFTETRAGW
ncbi:MAG: hypothetical protein ACOCXP_04055, partial [Candidatus Dojkabacteria bacterium]